MKSRLVVLAVVLSLFVISALAQENTEKSKSVSEELSNLERKSGDSTQPNILAAGNKGTEEIRQSGLLEKALNVGGRMPDFSLYDANNKLVSSQDLLKQGHLVVVFYRGAWCPFCNLYLRGLQRSLPEIKAQGANLVAISVESPDNSLSVSQKNKLDFTVLSDPNLLVARKFGIVYEMPKVLNDVILGLGFDIAAYNGMEKAELPLSATYVVTNEGEVIYAFLDPDYKKRADPLEIIGALSKANCEK